jgi:hypothetical protein
MMITQPIANGYTYGQPSVAHSPLSLSDFDLLKQTVLFGAEDEQYLRLAGDVLRDQVDAILDLWYGFVGSHLHLVAYFAGADGQPIADYLARVRVRFGQWIVDTCDRPYDQQWLDYQHEIGLRHHSTKKNQTDGVSAVPIIPLRYLIAFIFPITATMKGFLANKGHVPDVVEKMHAAWFKAVVLQATLWCYPFTREGQF